MSDFKTSLTFSKTILAHARDSFAREFFSGEAVCIRRLDQQISQFMLLLLTLAAMLGMAGLRSLIRM